MHGMARSARDGWCERRAARSFGTATAVAAPPIPHTVDSARLDLDAALATLGHASFRAGQREAIETLLDERSLLLVAPTGGGKSLVYQLPALLLPGTTLVVSPLVSLMADQVAALEARGIAASYLAATLEGNEMKARLRALAEGRYKIVYVAPERLAFDGFRALLARIDCPLVAVDEAHCISEWGHDFRPEYMQIGELLEGLDKAIVLACTATATPIVRDEILERLGLDATTPQLVHGFARPNLALRVVETRTRRERERRIDEGLAEALGTPDAGRGTAIIYSPTRRLAEEEAGRLAEGGWRAHAYHAGLSGAERDRVQKEFIEGRAEIVVATNAFGMGIDRPDVRIVAHLAPPGSIEAYYQEVGRAGRDGADAIGLLAISPGDMPVRRRLIESDVDGRSPDPEAVRHRWNLFLELMRWAEGGSCRHDAILRYFSDERETLAGCGRCDNCVSLADVETVSDEETSLIVRKALSAVARVHGRFGLQAAAKLLRGAEDPRLIASGLTTTKTFGILSDRSDDWLTGLLRRCVTAGWVDFHGGDRPVVILTEEGAAVMKSERPARLLLPPAIKMADHGTALPARSRAGSAPAADDLDETGRALFEALRRHRLELARKENVPPYVVASDRALRDIAALRPRTAAELEMAHGIGPSKAAKYGAGLLDVVARAAS
jgi:ATP-dependent DNA helicase RecQ